MAAAATARSAPAPRTAPARRPPARRRPARSAPARRTQRARPVPQRRPAGQLIPLAVGTASAVRRLPDSGLIVRLTRGRLWIGVLGLLLTGIVALNVVTLSFTATSSRIEQNIQALEQENSLLGTRDAQKSASERVQREATALGLTVPTIDHVSSVQAGPGDAAVAARRLEAAESGY